MSYLVDCYDLVPSAQFSTEVCRRPGQDEWDKDSLGVFAADNVEAEAGVPLDQRHLAWLPREQAVFEPPAGRRPVHDVVGSAGDTGHAERGVGTGHVRGGKGPDPVSPRTPVLVHDGQQMPCVSLVCTKYLWEGRDCCSHVNSLLFWVHARAHRPRRDGVSGLEALARDPADVPGGQGEVWQLTLSSEFQAQKKWAVQMKGQELNGVKSLLCTAWHIFGDQCSNQLCLHCRSIVECWIGKELCNIFKKRVWSCGSCFSSECHCHRRVHGSFIE